MAAQHQHILLSCYSHINLSWWCGAFIISHFNLRARGHVWRVNRKIHCVTEGRWKLWKWRSLSAKLPQLSKNWRSCSHPATQHVHAHSHVVQAFAPIYLSKCVHRYSDHTWSAEKCTMVQTLWVAEEGWEKTLPIDHWNIPLFDSSDNRCRAVAGDSAPVNEGWHNILRMVLVRSGRWRTVTRLGAHAFEEV